MNYNDRSDKYIFIYNLIPLIAAILLMLFRLALAFSTYHILKFMFSTIFEWIHAVVSLITFISYPIVVSVTAYSVRPHTLA